MACFLERLNHVTVLYLGGLIVVVHIVNTEERKHEKQPAKYGYRVTICGHKMLVSKNEELFLIHIMKTDFIIIIIEKFASFFILSLWRQRRDRVSVCGWREQPGR